MRRTSIWMPTELLDQLRRLSREQGAPTAELIRIAVSEYVEKKLKPK